MSTPTDDPLDGLDEPRTDPAASAAPAPGPVRPLPPVPAWNGSRELGGHGLAGEAGFTPAQPAGGSGGRGAASPGLNKKSPGLALFLSLIFPGVGQLYNGHTAKAFVFFAAFFGSLYAAIEGGNPLPWVFFLPFVIFYGLIDAWRSAALVNLRAEGGKPEEVADDAESPAWGITLIVVGVVLLLHTLGLLPLQSLQRFWPLVLIAAGVTFVLSSRRRSREAGDGQPR